MFMHSGEHTHSRPHRQIHLATPNYVRFASLVQSHPNVPPSALLVGAPTLMGSDGSVMKISPVLANKDRVKKERQKILNEGSYRNSLEGLTDLCRDHPEWIIQEQLIPVTVISMQTPLMRRQLIKDYIPGQPVNGMVSDAAHKFWRKPNDLLIITSSYALSLRRWIPAVLSYSDGASAAHYKLHFSALFKGMALQASQTGVQLEDHMFAGVCYRIY